MLLIGKLGEVYRFIRPQLSLYQSIVFFLQIFIAVSAAFTFPIFIRVLCLPSGVRFSTSLYFTFATCADQLAGVCSFPTATVSLNEEGWSLGRDIEYDVTAEIFLSKSKSIDYFGGFQVLFEAFDVNGKQTANYRRTAFLKKPSSGIFLMVKRLIFLPLYLIGWLEDGSSYYLLISFTDRFSEKSSSRTATLSVQIQNRFLQAESGRLELRARFGLLRHFLYYWPIVSYLVIFCICVGFNLSIVTVYWLFIGIKFYLRHRYESEMEDNKQKIAPGRSGRHTEKRCKTLEAPSRNAHFEAANGNSSEIFYDAPDESGFGSSSSGSSSPTMARYDSESPLRRRTVHRSFAAITDY